MILLLALLHLNITYYLIFLTGLPTYVPVSTTSLNTKLPAPITTSFMMLTLFITVEFVPIQVLAPTNTVPANRDQVINAQSQKLQIHDPQSMRCL